MANAEIGLDDVRISQRDLAGFQHVAIIGKLQGGAGVLIDKQNGDDAEIFLDGEAGKQPCKQCFLH